MILWILFALISAIIFSIKDILVKKLLNTNKFTPTSGVVQCYVGYFILSLLFMFMIDFKAIIDFWYLFLLKTICIVGFELLYFSLLQKHNISVVAPLLNVSPGFLLILSSIFLAERVSSMQLLGVLLIIVATYYLEVILAHHHKKKVHKEHFFHVKSKDAKYYFSILGLLLLISVVAMTDKVLLEHMNWQTNLFYLSILSIIFLTIIKKPKNITNALNMYVKQPLSIVYTVANVLSTVFILLAIAAPGALVSLAVPLRRTSTLFTSIFGGLLFHEKHVLKKAITVGIMLVGIILITL